MHSRSQFLNHFKMVMTPPTRSFKFLYSICWKNSIGLKIHINFNSYYINMIPLVFQSIQLILSLQDHPYTKSGSRWSIGYSPSDQIFEQIALLYATYTSKRSKLATVSSWKRGSKRWDRIWKSSFPCNFKMPNVQSTSLESLDVDNSSPEVSLQQRLRARHFSPPCAFAQWALDVRPKMRSNLKVIISSTCRVPAWMLTIPAQYYKSNVGVHDTSFLHVHSLSELRRAAMVTGPSKGASTIQGEPFMLLDRRSRIFSRTCHYRWQCQSSLQCQNARAGSDKIESRTNNNVPIPACITRCPTAEHVHSRQG